MPDSKGSAADLPAYVLFRQDEAHLKIAGVTLLDRQLAALHRGGCAPITIVSKDPVQLPARVQAQGIAVQLVAALPSIQQDCLIVDGNAFVEIDDVVALRTQGGDLEDSQGSRVRALRASSPAMWSVRWEKPEEGHRSATACRNLTTQEEATRLGQSLLKVTSSSSDGLVDRVFNRPLSRYLTGRLLETNIPPSLISLLSIGTGLLGALLLAVPRPGFAICGALLFQLSAIIDCTDGDLARLHLKESLFGKWLDIVGDQIVHIAIFVGIGFGLIKTLPSLTIVLLTISAVVGAILAFATFLWVGKRSGGDPRIDKLLQITANRDFSIIVLLLAFIGRLDIFAWLVGIGIHLYWMTLLVISLRNPAGRETTP